MQSVVVTHLKAPWPDGVRVGDVVAFPGGLPGWAAGKCVDAAPEAEPVAVYVPAEPVDREFVVNPAAEANEKTRAAEAMLAAAEEESAELRSMLAEMQAERDAARAEVEALTVALAEASAKAEQAPATKRGKA